MLEEVRGRRVEPLAVDWRGFGWSTGRFDTARRDLTPVVEGNIAMPHHLVMVTLAGTARRVEVTADCGHRYDGADSAGAVSFVPAGCGRRFVMRDVQSEWASISLRADLLCGAEDQRPIEIGSFTHVRDPFIASLVGEIARLRVTGSNQKAEYCDAMTLALAQHLICHYGQAAPAAEPASRSLPAWRLRRITDYVEAHLDRAILTAELARIAGLSSGHFHRALRATTGQTPLDFVNRRRMERARQLLADGALSITEICLEIGFSSPSHFSRLFRRETGLTPSEYRAGLRRSSN